jgi:uncharacterized protein YdeI (YjbR/CyaY-like superfamily)
VPKDAMKLLAVTDRAKWRAWLEKHHDKESEIWLVYFRKGSGKPRISYNDSVEEALCFGWIDSIQKGIDDERLAQRFTPRRRMGGLSEMNKQRVRRLAREGKMTTAGMAVIGDALEEEPLTLSADVERALRKDPDTWKNFKGFPESYRRVRMRMTSQNKRYGWVKEFR